MACWGVYIIESQSTGHLFTGVTTRPTWRMHMLNSGQGVKFAKGKGPWILAYWEPRGSQAEALKREGEIKTLTKAQKLTLIKQHT
jgi:putative endonuclease